MRIEETGVSGLLRIKLDVRTTPDGYFKENFHREKLPFAVAQHNVLFLAERGVAKGVHAEAWGKYLSPSAGRLFAAIVELRDGPDFGRVETFELGPGDGLYVPPGCGNSFCTLTPHTVYDFLLTEPWRADAPRTNVNLFDPELAIPWPFPRSELTYSEQDATHPLLRARPGEGA